MGKGERRISKQETAFRVINETHGRDPGNDKNIQETHLAQFWGHTLHRWLFPRR